MENSTSEDDKKNKALYDSLKGSKKVTAAQYITELICVKKARQEGVSLSVDFWKIDKWKKYFKSQVFTAYKLLKQYPHDAIVRALEHKKSNKIYSLRSPRLPAIIEMCMKEQVAPKTEKINKVYGSKGDFLLGRGNGLEALD